MQKFPMTVAGEASLRRELTELKSVSRPKITAAIAEARAHGDLKENAEYHAAREQQSFCEGRVKEIGSKLSNSQVIDVSKIDPTGRVIFGTTVTLINLETDATVTYQIVGEDEADVSSGKISVISPIARAMMGKEEGEEIVLKAPAGDIEYEIDTVKHI
ncbi:MAG: transcription elongation factor GreA [Pseudomonadales bacterium]|nr:transcription elongation factor GreA [Pseudomonadales bacterium]